MPLDVDSGWSQSFENNQNVIQETYCIAVIIYIHFRLQTLAYCRSCHQESLVTVQASGQAHSPRPSSIIYFFLYPYKYFRGIRSLSIAAFGSHQPSTELKPLVIEA